jgi:hypothetical protein
LELATLSEAGLFEYLKTNHYFDLLKSEGTYDTFDCTSESKRIYAELKCRRTHYPDIYAFHLEEFIEPAWEERAMPATTEFGNRSKIGKIVGFLPLSFAKLLYAPVSL